MDDLTQWETELTKTPPLTWQEIERIFVLAIRLFLAGWLH